MQEWKLTSRSPRRCSCSCVCWVLGWEEESDWRWAVSSSSAVSSASLCPLSAHWLSPVVYTDTQQHKKVKSSVVSCYKFKSFLFRTTHFLVFLSISFHSIHKGLHTLHSLHVCFLKILANMIIRSYTRDAPIPPFPKWVIFGTCRYLPILLFFITFVIKKKI